MWIQKKNFRRGSSFRPGWCRKILPFSKNPAFILAGKVLFFALMFYVHSIQLRSCWDSQLLNHCSWASLPFFCQVTDNFFFLNQRKEIIFPPKNVPDQRIDRGSTACEADKLPTELPCLVCQTE